MASAEAGDGSGKEDKSYAMALNPGVPIRGIRMKFAVLAGLVEVKEVSNRDIVETVFNLLVGGQFDLEMNFIIQEPESIVCMVELLDQCEPTCQAEVWSIFTAILKKSVRNLQACTQVGLIQLVLDRIATTDSMIADLLVDMLGVLASYSITVKELKLFFSKLQGEKGHWPRHAVKLLSVLKYMAHRNGPDSFFSFPGKNAAAIALPPIAKWPYQNGFTFHTWLRMDPLNNINVDKDKPYLYCFRTSKGLGYSAHFVGGCLIVTSLKSKGKGFQHCVKYDFKPQKWYMVSLVHVYNRWKNCEISCYVNGELASFGDISWFVSTSDTFDKCFLGSSETADANRVFCGQMGAVYLFSEALSAAHILAIYQLGPGYQGTFKHKAESDLLFAEHHKTLLYDGKLSSCIAFSYNPRATDAQLCLESSPKENASIFVHSPHALMLQDVKAVVTHSVQSGIHSIGGVQVLFPLFAQLDYRQPSSNELDTSVCCTLLSFVMELLKNSVAMQEQVLACKGFLVIGYTLEKFVNSHVTTDEQSSKLHVTRPILDIVLAFSRYLSNLPNGILLLKQLCDHIMFNPAIWIHAPSKVQLTLYTYLATEFVSTVTIYNAIRRVGTVLQVMHTLKYYYWVVNPQDRSGVVPKGTDGPRPNERDIFHLRTFLLLFVKQLIMKDHGVKEDEVQSILNYLLTLHEDDNLMDVLQLLVALMSESPASMAQAFDQRNGIRVIFKLLASKSEPIRVQSLKVLGYFVKHMPPKRKAEVMLSHGLFSLLTERLMLNSQQISMTTYNVLFEILTEQICTQVIYKQHPDPDSAVKILNPQILKVIAALLKNSAPSPETMEVRRVFLSDMIKLFNNSRENRRSLLQCSVWQEWMLSLCFINPRNTEEQKITEMVYAIFRILLYHAIKYEWGGWRVWVDTLSITHSKVAFEQHKENLARMFRQYQHQESSSTVPSISLASQTSETMDFVNGQTLEEAPSTVIELTVDQNSQKPLESTPSETLQEEAERGQTSITVSNILARDEEDIRGGEEAEAAPTIEVLPVVEEDKETSATDSAITDEEKSEVEKDESSASLTEDSANEVKPEPPVSSEQQEMNERPCESEAATANDALEEASVLNQDLPDTSSVSDQVQASDAEESHEESEVAANAEDGVVKDDEVEEEEKKVEADKEEPAEEKEVSDTESQKLDSPQEDVVDTAKDESAAEQSSSKEPTTEEQPSTSSTAPSAGHEETGEQASQPSGTVAVTTEEDTSSKASQEGLPTPNPVKNESVDSTSKTKEIKIARLDVSNVALDTERLELKETSTTNTSQSQPAGSAASAASEQPRDSSTSAPRSTMFRIPEFRWSHMHQRLLTDLLFSIETDVQMWRSHSTKTVLDFVNSSENAVFVHNSIHLISQVVDNLIMACGGILPLLSAATSSTHELENIEPSQGLALEASVTYLQRLISLVDVLVFASSLNFSEIEAEKNMSSGGILRQCLRLVCAMAVRNCLECQQAHIKQNKEAAARTATVLGTSKSAIAQSPVDAVTGGMSPIRDLDRLLQDMDINRLRAVVFRDIDSKQAQFLALAVVYFISVLMVSKYRDILEPHNDKKGPQRSQSARSTDSGAVAGGAEVENGISLRRYDSGIGEDHTSTAPSEAELSSSSSTTHGPDAISEALSTLSSEVKPSATPDAKGKNVKDILRSLVSTPADDLTVDPTLLPPAFLGVGDVAPDPTQFRSFDRSVVVAPKKPGMPPAPASSAPAPAASAASVSGGTPLESVSVVSATDASQSTSTDPAAAGQDPASASLPSVPPLSPVTQNTTPSMSISERLEHALEKAAPLLREIFVDFAPFLSRTLLGSHGQELLIEGTSLVCMKSSSSVVELVMLLCSQEWQNSIQKNAGLAFIELVNEGRLLSHTMKDHLVRVANEAEFILSRQRAEDIHKHAEFESHCAQYSAEKREEEKMCDHLIRAAKYRDHVTSTQLIQKIVNILTDKHGAWGHSAKSRPREFWRLDYWEDDLRRRRRFARNPLGSTHSEATLKAATEHASEEDVLKTQQSIRSQALGNQNCESETLLDGDEDTLSSLDDKELDNVTGPVNLSTTAHLVAPAVVVKGTLSVTASELYFEVDDEEPSFKALDPKILAYTEGLHGKWLFTEIRAVFSRRYLLQNTALEIFMANRTAVMFNFPDAATVKKVVNSLPRVGVGTNFGLPQTRRISLATPKQLFKASNMTQRWQRREISNFEYLIFLNTMSGRSYNDLNQYPVFPWVITNYESEELDLTLPSNFRDLSKPIGALNPKRAAFFSDRYESWEDEQVPKFHYGTHYSTSSFTQMWLLRMEPFTTFFLNFQGGKFDHADRTFSSVSRAWRNCQRDTSDVKELIPEFFYLPEMFVNANSYSLGVMEDGAVVSDVELPPWAKTPEEFVRINRLALESEFVSCQLHQWIDLIFGYKQQGPEAARALNVFYYLTYEGAVNLSSISDPILREAVESQIRSFGQTPCQLLIEPHPPRSSAMQVTPLMFTEQMQQDVIMVLKFPSNSPVAHVAANTQAGLSSSAIITVTASRLFAVNKWHGLAAHQGSTTQDQHYQLPVEIDPLIASNVGIHRRQISDLLDQSIQISSQCFVITADNRFIILCGFWDKSFRVYSTDTGKLTQIVFGHWDVVTCLARSESYIGGDCYMLSGSRDATLLLWYWNGKACSIGESSAPEFTMPRAILTGHDCEVTCASVCAELGLVISGCKEGPCLIHSMNGDLLRTLDAPEACVRPRLVQSSSEGHCVIYYDRGHFCVFSINGKLQGHMQVDDSIKAMQLSRDGQYLLMGGDGGVVSVWQLHNLKQLFTYPACDAGIRSMAMSHDQRCIITGMASGSIVLFYNDFNRWHHEYQTRY
ncbi:lipopolysaccharide-responsive and beige-like anchor protein isoform X3 [Periophthalmus magnuspinnatus]|uniref:lipopolysaccharide-responsive and beige-like anchor protein isoform X3 n=1 Tax=Periophthalmus magnuspinnatus TaxID=409849 RepID=UPI0024368CCE|nr:lipopolysaccharide-responsive and beige-like anchor protein isoform X3 [Periophthalmus magnuspinnatus]